jgi:hypothetical protein
MRLARLIALAALLTAPAAWAALRYPADCKSSTLRRAANKNGCTFVSGTKHHKVMKNGQQVTLIPNDVKQNGTCRGIIDALNTHC